MLKKMKIIKEFATLSNYKDFTKEFNLIDYGLKEPYFDIRKWDRSPINESPIMLKGITLNKNELKILKEAINKIELD